MSKRSGEFISVNDLLNEVNKDAIRFMMLNRSNDVEIDFDFDKVLEKVKKIQYFMFSIVMQEYIQSFVYPNKILIVRKLLI